MRLYRSSGPSASISWPKLVLDCPVKIGTNTIRDAIKRGRVVVRCYGRPDWFVEMTWPEVARFAVLHQALVTYLAAQKRRPRRRQGVDKRGY